MRPGEWLASLFCPIDTTRKRLRSPNLPTNNLRPEDDFQNINYRILFTNI